MSREADVLIYVKSVITDLGDEFFSPSQNPMMEKDVFEKYLSEIVNKNFDEFGCAEIDEDQLVDIIVSTNNEVFNEVINSLYKKGLIDMKGIDSDGDEYYGATKLGHAVVREITK